MPNMADQTGRQPEASDLGNRTSATDDPEEESGPDLPNTAGLDLPNLVGRSAINGMVIPSGIHSIESGHQDRAAVASAFGSLPMLVKASALGVTCADAR